MDLLNVTYVVSTVLFSHPIKFKPGACLHYHKCLLCI